MRVTPCRRLVFSLVVLAAIVGAWRPTGAQEPRRERRPWLARLRITPTLPTDHEHVRSPGGFGLHLAAEAAQDDSRLAIPLGFELAGDDRRQLGCVTGCAQGRMSAWLLTSGLTVRPFPAWKLRPFVEGTVSGGLVQWSNASLPAGLGIGTLVGGRTGGGFTSRASVGAGLEWRGEERWYVVGLQRGLVQEARWSPGRMVTTLVLGIRSRT